MKARKYTEEQIIAVMKEGEAGAMPTSSYRTEGFHQAWTTVYQRGGGHSGGWSFDEYRYTFPNRFIFSVSSRTNDDFALMDADLYLLEAGVAGADEEIIEAIKDSIACFKGNLYRPAVVMLGKAMEGAWLELGVSIMQYMVKLGSKSEEDVARFKASDKPITIMSKISKIVEMYNRKELKTVRDKTGISNGALNSIMVWSDILRDSRNAIHFSVKPTLPNTYEKVAILLIAASKYFKSMYCIKKATDEEVI